MNRLHSVIPAAIHDFDVCCGIAIVAPLARQFPQWNNLPILAQSKRSRAHDLKGFARPNLFRMCQFFDTYCGNLILAALPRELPWQHNLAGVDANLDAVSAEPMKPQGVHS